MAGRRRCGWSKLTRADACRPIVAVREGDCSDNEYALPAATCSSPGSTTTLSGRDVALELFSRIRHVDAGLAGYQMVDHDTGMGQQTLISVLPQPVQGRRGTPCAVDGRA
jgi:hypothetical protein